MISFLIRLFLFPLLSVIVMLVCSRYFVDIFGLQLTPADFSSLVGLSLIGSLFWFVDTIVAGVIKIFTLPLCFLTLGLSNLIINTGVLYLLQRLLNTQVDLGYTLTLGSFVQTMLVSIVIALGTTALRWAISLIIK
ncbi:MAG: phage holin family protein [Candidatus Absconditabacterales bacterium]|nr:phage holin family protein [Candidatus Absconditabacterales bacterium]